MVVICENDTDFRPVSGTRYINKDTEGHLGIDLHQD